MPAQHTHKHVYTLTHDSPLQLSVRLSSIFCLIKPHSWMIIGHGVDRTWQTFYPSLLVIFNYFAFEGALMTAIFALTIVPSPRTKSQNQLPSQRGRHALDYWHLIIALVPKKGEKILPCSPLRGLRSTCPPCLGASFFFLLHFYL